MLHTSAILIWLPHGWPVLSVMLSCPTPLVLLQHTSATPTATARMDYPLYSYTRTCTDHPPHHGSHESGLDSGSGGTVQLAKLVATAGGRDASSASCPSTMATPVNTFASGVELTPDDVEINEQGKPSSQIMRQRFIFGQLLGGSTSLASAMILVAVIDGVRQCCWVQFDKLQ